MINLPIKSEVSTFTHEDMKGNAKHRNWVAWGCARSLAMLPFDTMHTTSYLTSTETMHPSCIVFELRELFCQKSPIFNLSTCILRSLWC